MTDQEITQSLRDLFSGLKEEGLTEAEFIQSR